MRVRDFDFEFATLVFEGPTLEREDQRRDYGETRIIAIGLAQGISITVVYTDRAEAGRLAQGPRYQSRMNAVLRAYMSAIEKGAA